MCLRRAPEKYIAGAKAPAGAALDRAALHRSDPISDPPNFLPNVYRGPLPGGRAAGREAENLPPTNAFVKKTWIYESTPPILLNDNFLTNCLKRHDLTRSILIIVKIILSLCSKT
jgi:hypothetical protein